MHSLMCICEGAYSGIHSNCNCNGIWEVWVTHIWSWDTLIVQFCSVDTVMMYSIFYLTSYAFSTLGNLIKSPGPSTRMLDLFVVFFFVGRNGNEIMCLSVKTSRNMSWGEEHSCFEGKHLFSMNNTTGDQANFHLIVAFFIRKSCIGILIFSTIDREIMPLLK